MPKPSFDELQSQLLDIVKRDLKLQGVDLTPTTSLAAGDLDLDSLDFLLLVSSIEKHFGVRIPNDKLGPETMKDVATLAHFIHGRLA